MRHDPVLLRPRCAPSVAWTTLRPAPITAPTPARRLFHRRTVRPWLAVLVLWPALSWAQGNLNAPDTVSTSPEPAVVPRAVAPVPLHRPMATGWTLRSGDPLAAQVREVVERQGYHLAWHLDHDVPAGTSAGNYPTWQQLVVAATQEMARMSTTGEPVGAPLVCPISHQVIVARRNEAARLALQAPGSDCVPLRSTPRVP